MQIEYRHNKKESPFSKTIKLTTLGLSLFTLVNGGLIFHNYYKSLNWSTNRDSLKMADMPIDTLNDSTKQVKNKEEFLVLAQKAMTPDGQIHLNQKSQLQLLNALNKIKTAKPLYQAKYDKIMDKYRIRQKLNALYKNKHTLKESSTPTKVENTLDSIAPKLNEIYQKNNKDKFVQDQLKRVHLLVNDTNKIINITNQLNNVVYISHGTLQPHADLTPTKYEKILNQFNKLHYKWLCLKHYYKLQEQIDELLNKQQDKLNIYHTYENDLHDRDKAYKDWENKRKQRKHDYIKSEKEKQKQKEAEARADAKQRAEEEKQQESLRREQEELQREEDNNEAELKKQEHDNQSSNNSNAASNHTSSHQNSNSGNNVVNSNPNNGTHTPSTSHSTNNAPSRSHQQSRSVTRSNQNQHTNTDEADDDSNLYAN